MIWIENEPKILTSIGLFVQVLHQNIPNIRNKSDIKKKKNAKIVETCSPKMTISFS